MNKYKKGFTLIELMAVLVILGILATIVVVNVAPVFQRANLEKIKADIALQHQLLAFASDYSLLLSATLPHRKDLDHKRMYYASLDHALWFHRDFKIDDWLLYSIESPSASNARGFARGSIFNSEGSLIASVTQEGLMRKYK